MRYQPAPVPTDREDLARHVEIEQQRVADALQDLDTLNVYLTKLSASPVRPRDGQLVYADGTNWNPGSGAGVYYFNGSTWNFLG